MHILATLSGLSGLKGKKSKDGGKVGCMGIHRGRIVGKGNEAILDQNILYVCMHELLKQSYCKNDNEAGHNTF